MADETPVDPVVLERECDRYRPYYYAAASGDFNPIHLDAELAKAVGLPGNILHGMCTMAWAAEAAIEALGGDPGALKTLHVRFSRPVKIDDKIKFTAVCDASGKIKISAVNQEGTDILKNAEATGGQG